MNRWSRAVSSAAITVALGVGVADEVRAQHIQVEARAGFLVTFAEGHSDRPTAAVDIGIPILSPSVGGPPGVTLTGGVSVGFAEFFADVQSESFRFMGGIETPWSISAASLGRSPVQIVPHLEVGHLDSNGGDRRSGLVWRAGLGLRVPVGVSNMHFTFEPLALVRLPEGEVIAVLDEPLRLSGLSDSRLALEFGVISLGWQF